MVPFCQKYLLQANYDDEIFEVNIKVINSSVLLKNMFELTDGISSAVPIGIDCSSNSLKAFINLVNIYENDEKSNLENAKELLKDFTDTSLTEFIKEICILDCDIVLNIIADKILDNIKDMCYTQILEYLNLEDDFTLAERAWQNKNMLEYLISLNDASSPLSFPLKCQNFCSIKSKFLSPMNVILARICERSNEIVAFELGLCCKALKNECDRHPIKLSRLLVQNFNWYLKIDGIENYDIQVKKQNEKYFAAIFKRKAMAMNDNILISFGSDTFYKDIFEVLKSYLSCEWIVPHKNEKKIEVSFTGSEIYLSNFNLQKFPFCRIDFSLYSFDNGIDFDFVYYCLIAKDLSKFIEVSCGNFKFFPKSFFRLFKKPNANKFYQCWNYNSADHTIENDKRHFPTFKSFLIKYMESDGHFQFIGNQHSWVPQQLVKSNQRLKYQLDSSYCIISDLLEYL